MFATDEFQAISLLEDDDKQELEEKFSSAPLPKKFAAEDEEKVEETKGPATAGILEAQRMTNLEIMLRKFDAKPKEIAEAVRSLDPLGETLTLDNINALISNQIKPEEIALAQAYEGTEEEIANLNKPELFAYYVARVPRWNQKVKTMFTMYNSKNLVAEVTTTIDNVINATKEVHSSEKLKRVFASVLAVGNFMNQGTARGSAKGFRLDSLQKLSEIKMRQGGQTLLHYLAAVLKKKSPEVLSLCEDMPSVKFAKRMAKEDIAKEVLTFQGCVQVMGREITVMRKESNESPRKSKSPPAPPASQDVKVGEEEKKEVDGEKRTALEVAIEMHREAENKLKEITGKHDEMLRRFSELAVFLGEDIRHAKIEELFATIATFLGQLEKCTKENEDREKEIARKARIEARKAENAEKAKARASLKATNSRKDMTDEAAGVTGVGKPVPIKTGNKVAAPEDSNEPDGSSIRIEETSPVSVSAGVEAPKS